MKTRLLLIIAIIIAASTSIEVDQAYASCDGDVNYDHKLKESELVFTGTVTRLDNYDGPQRVTFIIHDIIKGEIDTPKHILENLGKIFLEDGATRGSSISVDYTIGKTYKVYVENGNTNSCTTKITTSPADYIWEPGPEDGNYYSENPVWVNPCDEGYGLSDDVCITLEEMNKDLPTCDQNPKHDFGKCKKVYEEPNYTLQHVIDICNSTGFEFGEQKAWWNQTHYIDTFDCEFLDKFEYPTPPHLEPNHYPKEAAPYPEPDQDMIIYEYCGPETELVDGICLVTLEENSNQTKNQNEKWPAAYRDVLKNSEPEPPTMSHEQEQMMREYCATGIRHPDMIGIPQCIKNVPGCGPGPMFVDGICHLVITDFFIHEDQNGMGGFILIGIPAIAAIIIISIISYKKSEK